MSLERLKNLSLEELQHLEQCIQIALEEKTLSRLEKAKRAVLGLMAEQFPEVAIADLCEQLQPEASHPIVPLAPSVPNPAPMAAPAAPVESVPVESVPADGFPASDASDMTTVLRNLHVYRVDLQEKHGEVLAREQARLLWLTHGGKQKMSCVYGQQLAEILQEAINQLERAADESLHQSPEIIQHEIENISMWLESYTGIPLVGGMLTVIAPPLLKQPNPEPELQPQPQHQPRLAEPLTFSSGIQMPPSRPRLN